MNTLGVLFPSGELDRPASKANLLQEFPGLASQPLDAMLGAVEATLGDIRPNVKKQPQYLWLFFLAGRLKAFFNADDQADEATALILSPLAWVFADLVRGNGLTGRKDRVDWSDAEAVEIDWLNAWVNRKLPVGSSALAEALAVAVNNPLQLTGNRYFVLVVNMGYALQKQNGDFPFILPVNAKVARMLQTTMPTVAGAVAKAIRDGFFVIVDEKFSPSARRARLFRFNEQHPALQRADPTGSRTETSS